MNKVKARSDLFENKGKFLFKYLPMPSYAWQKIKEDLILIDFNDAAYDITKGNIEKFVGIKATELYRDQPEIFRDLQRSFREKCNFFKEMTYEFKSIDKERFLCVNYGYIPPDIVIVHTNDITEKKIAEQKVYETKKRLEKSEQKLKELNLELEKNIDHREKELKKSLEMYKLINENTNDVILIVNKDSVIEYINKRPLLRNFGYNLKDILGKSPRDFLHPDDLVDGIFPLMEYLKKGKENIEVKIKHKKDYYIPVEIGISLFLDSNKEPKQLVIIRNIEKRKAVEHKIKESEEGYRLITENINDLIAILNEDYKYEYINEPIHQKSRGRSNKDLIGTSPIDITHPDEIEKSQKAFRQAFRDGESKVEARIRNIWGGYNWFEVKGRNFKDVDGKKKLLIVSRDITTRKKNEEKLKESEEKYRILFENAQEEQDLTRALLENQPDFIYFKDRKTRFRHVSKHFYEFLGISKKDMIGKTDFDFFPEELAKINHYEELQVINTGTPIINKEDSDAGTWVLTTKIPWVDKNGNIKGLFGISRDITERKKAELKLIESEEKYRNLLNNIHETIFELDEKGKIEYISPQVYDITGYKPEEQIGINLVELIHPEDLELVYTLFNKLLQSGEVQSAEFRRKHKDGHYIYVNSSGR